LVKFLAGWLRVKRNRPATIHFFELLRALLLAGLPHVVFASRFV